MNRKLSVVGACLAGALSATAAFRPPAVPLVSVEPHFSVWSAANRLTDADTTHWGGARQPLSIILTADGGRPHPVPVAR